MSHALYERGAQFLKYFGTSNVFVTVLAVDAASSAVPGGNATVIAPVGQDVEDHDDRNLQYAQNFKQVCGNSECRRRLGGKGCLERFHLGRGRCDFSETFATMLRRSSPPVPCPCRT